MEAPPQQMKRDKTRSKDPVSKGPLFSAESNIYFFCADCGSGTEASEDLEEDILFEEDPVDNTPLTLELLSFGTFQISP